jgi:predicted metal-binding protein
MPQPKPVALTLCVQCGTPGVVRGRNGKKRANPANQKLAVEIKHLLDALDAQVQVRLSRCQENCNNPCSWQLASAHGESLQFGKGGQPGGPQAADIAAVACAYAALPVGERFNKKEFPVLKGTMAARVAPWPRVKAQPE